MIELTQGSRYLYPTIKHFAGEIKVIWAYTEEK